MNKYKKKEIIKNKISVAPMVDRTDRHFRNFVRMINKDMLLYTEMITAQAIINGDLDYILGFDKIENPIVLQIAATSPEDAYKAVKISEKYDYDEINLNVGCPSDRVSGNMMGACLMAYPEKVAKILEAMNSATSKPVSIKHRIGIDGTKILPDEISKKVFDTYEDMKNFVEIVKIKSAYKFVSREFKKSDTIIDIKGHLIGGDNFMFMAGPCSVENKEMLSNIAKEVKKGGAVVLRGGAYKPRTSPYDFQGLGEIALKYLREVADKNDMLVVTEAMDVENLDLVCTYSDIIQIGARNMQNFSLLKKLGKVNKPILLKRGLSATINEFLLSAEYIIAHGNREVILCERGIRTFETMTRNTLDINAIALIKELSHLPIIIDASHGTGKRSLVEPITLAGIFAGANGAMVEVHENPDCALSDGPQSLDFKLFEKLARNIKKSLIFRKELD